MIKQEFRQSVALDGLHYNVEEFFVKKIFLHLDDVEVIEVFEVLDLFKCMNLLLFLHWNDFAYALNFTDTVDNFAYEACRTPIKDFREIVKLKNLPTIVPHELPVTYLIKLIRIGLGICQLADVFFYERFATYLLIIILYF